MVVKQLCDVKPASGNVTEKLPASLITSGRSVPSLSKTCKLARNETDKHVQRKQHTVNILVGLLSFLALSYPPLGSLRHAERGRIDL